MRRRYYMAIAFLLAFGGVHPSKAQKLVLWHADNSYTEVELYKQPRVTFEGDKVLITSSVLNMEYPKEDVLRFTYKGSADGIGSLTLNEDYFQEEEKLVFHGIGDAKDIALYTANGIRVPVQIAHSGNDVILPLSLIPSGFYMLSLNGKTFKFSKP